MVIFTIAVGHVGVPPLSCLSEACFVGLNFSIYIRIARVFVLMLHPFCWAGWAKARRGCFSGGNLGICFIGLLGLEVWSLFHLSPVSNFTLTLSYVVVALFVVVLIFGVSATFIKYHRLKRSGSGGVVGRDELKAVAGHWGVCLLFAGLVGIVGALMDSRSEERRVGKECSA